MRGNTNVGDHNGTLSPQRETEGQRRVIWINFPALAVSRQHGNRGQEGEYKDFLPLPLFPANDVPAEILQDELGGLGLARAGLARDDEALVGAVALQVPVGGLGQREHVGLEVPDLAAVVLEHRGGGVVVGQLLVRVDRHQDGARVGLQQV